MYKFLFLLWALPVLGSTILYSNFTANQPPYSSLGEDINDQRYFYSTFQPDSSGVLDSIKLPLYARLSPQVTGPLSIVLVNDDILTLEAWTLPATSVNPFAITLITLQSVVNPFLTQGNKYYLMLGVPNTETGTYVWARNLQQDKQGTAIFNGAISSGLTSGAFEVSGTTGVPEPSTWLTVSASFAALLLFRRC